MVVARRDISWRRAVAVAILCAVSGLAFAIPPTGYFGGYQGFATAPIWPPGGCPGQSPFEALSCGCRAWRSNAVLVGGRWGVSAFMQAVPDPNGGILCVDPAIPPFPYGLWAVVATQCPPGTTLRVPPGSNSVDYDSHFCAPASAPLEVRAQNLGAPKGACPVGNPVNPSIGNKVHVEEDYRSEGPAALRFRRIYNSDETALSTSMGARWHHAYDRRLVSAIGRTPAANESVLYLRRGDGGTSRFQLNPDGMTYSSASDPGERLRRRDAASGGPGWELRSQANDATEHYRADGLLSAEYDRAGLAVRFDYDSFARLSRVYNDFGTSITLDYGPEDRIARMVGPGNWIIEYEHDKGRLVSVRHPDNAVRTYLYEDVRFPRALTGILDENGSRFASWEYDEEQRAVLSVHAGNVDRFEFAYNADGSATVIDPLGAARTYRYVQQATAKLLTAVEGPPNPSCGNSPTTIYAGTFPTSRADWNGTVTTYTRADSQRPDLETSRTEASGTPQARTITTQWHPTFRLPVRVAEPGRVTEMVYDARGNMTARTVTDTASGRTRTWTWTHTYSATVPGMVERTVADGPRSDLADTTTTDYWPADAACPGTSPTGCRGQLQRITNALGHVTEVGEYSAHGQPTHITDPNGLVTVLAYDARRRLVSRTVGTETTAYEYDPVGSLIKTTFPDGSLLAYDFDDARRLVSIADSLGNRIDYTLDAMGNRIAEATYDAQNVLRSKVSRQFDAENRLRAVIGGTDPAAQVTRYAYDPQGNLKTIDGPLATVPNDLVTMNYDRLNRLEQSIDPLGGTTRLERDALDRLLSVVDPRGVPTTYAVDAFGNRLREVSRDRGTTVSTFDEAGNPLSVLDGRGQVVTYQTDALGRLVYRSVDSGAPWEYDGGAGGDPNAKGRLTKAYASSGWTSFRYDLHGRIIEKTQRAGNVTRVLGYGYDAAGRLSRMTYPSGKVITYAYDAQGRVSAIRLGEAEILSGARYFPFGAVEAFVWGNGTHYARGFDLDGRIVSFPAGASTRTITYDTAGRVAAMADSGTPALNFSAVYDANDRLVGYSGFPASQAFSYDANGNRSSITVASHTYPYSVDPASNRLAAVAGPAPARAYAYDGMGNIVSDGTRAFRYDPLGRLSSVSVAGQPGPSFAHNAFGERVRKGPAGRGNYAYDEAGRLIGEYDTWQKLIPQEYVYLGDQLVAILKGTSESPEVYYVHTDHLGSPRVVLDTQNRERWRWEGGPFGDNLPDQNPAGLGTFTLHLRFPGQYFDVETGLHYNYFRDYDPQTGRYVQSDPIGLDGGINPFAFALGNPLSFVDPLGLSPDGPSVRYSPADLANVENHLRWVARMQGVPYEELRGERAMLDRLKRGMSSSFDIAFYLHERTEANVCRVLFAGKDPRSMSPEEITRLLRLAHEETMRRQRTSSSADLYHPSVVQRFPGYFLPSSGSSR